MSLLSKSETDETSSATTTMSVSESEMCASDEMCSLMSNSDVRNTDENLNEDDLTLNQSSNNVPTLHQLIVEGQLTLPERETGESEVNEDDEKSLDGQGVSKAYFVVVNDANRDEIGMNEDHDQNFLMNEKDHFGGGAEMDIEKLQRMNSDFDHHDIANSSFGEENILEHLSRQVTLQHQYLCNAISVNNGHSTLERMYEDNSDSSLTTHQMTSATTTPATTCVSNIALSADQFTLLPNLLSQQHIQNTGYITSTPQHSIYSHQTLSDEDHLQDSPATIGISNQESGGTTPLDPQRFVTIQNGSGRYLYTPHPKTGQLLYVSCEDSSPQLFHRLSSGSSVTTPLRVDTSSQFVTPKVVRLTPGQLPEGISRLNSSGEDVTSPDCPSDVPSTPYGSSPDSNDDKSSKFTSIDLSQALFCGPGEESREQHNMKERRRRARIKDACDVMRKLVPGMSDKTDKATVFEFAARYIHYLKGFAGTRHDKDFLLKYSPY